MAAIVETGQGEERRDLSVGIKPRKAGFNVTWKTARRVSPDRTKEKSYSIDFERTSQLEILEHRGSMGPDLGRTLDAKVDLIQAVLPYTLPQAEPRRAGT